MFPAQPPQPSGQHVGFGRHPNLVVYFRGEPDQFQALSQVLFRPHLVLDGSQTELFQLGPGPLFQKYLLQVFGHLVPDLAVDDVVGGGEAGQRAIHVLGHLVPALAVGRVGPDYAAVQDAPLQGGVHLGEGHELGRSAHAVNSVGKRGAVTAGLLTL